MTKEEKKIKIHNMMCNKSFFHLPFLFVSGFDADSDNMLDEKIDMLERLEKGEKIEDIDPEYKLFELIEKG